MTVNQISIFIENKPGSIAAFADILRTNGIDLRALSIADVQDYGILRVIVSDAHKATTALKNAGYVLRLTQVLAVPLRDTPGSLAEALDVLGAASVNIEYLYAFVGRRQDQAYVIFRVADNEIERAHMALAKAGLTPVNQEQLKQLDSSPNQE